MWERGSSTRGPGTRHALLGAALAVFGLLSMHGWGSHAGLHAEATHAPAPVVMLDDHGQGGAVAAEPENPSCGGECGGSGRDGGRGLLELCLAVLAVTMLGLALLRHCRRPRLLRRMPPAFIRPVLLGRDRDPPDLLRLCVIRC